jgi:hypothetical protein
MNSTFATFTRGQPVRFVCDFPFTAIESGRRLCLRAGTIGKVTNTVSSPTPTYPHRRIVSVAAPWGKYRVAVEVVMGTGGCDIEQAETLPAAT